MLYGGTAVALQLGHRVSVDFDFFSDRPFAPDALRRDLPILEDAQTLDAGPDTLTVSLVPAGQDDSVKLSFFAGSVSAVPAHPSDRAMACSGWHRCWI